MSVLETTRGFVAAFLAERGALVESNQATRRLDILVPEPLVSRLGMDFIEIPLDEEELCESQLLVPGSPLLEGILREAVSSGRCARWYLWIPLKKKVSEEDVLRRASLFGLKVKELKAAQTYVPHPLFHFQVSYVSDDKQEELVSALVHPFLGRAVPYGPAESAMAGPRNELGLDEMDPPPARRAYEIAEVEALAAVEPRIESCLARERRRLLRESGRVHEYYSSARRELRRRAAREGIAPERKSRLLDKIRLFAAEEQRKLLDLQTKHRLSVRFELVNAAIVMIPQVRVEVLLEARGAPAGAAGAGLVRLAAFWDPLSREMAFPSCPVCGGELLRIAACPRCGRLVCQDDLSRCCRGR